MRQENNDPSQKDRQSSLGQVDRIREELLPVTLVYYYYDVIIIIIIIILFKANVSEAYVRT